MTFHVHQVECLTGGLYNIWCYVHEVESLTSELYDILCKQSGKV